jgi:hypothetical protein
MGDYDFNPDRKELRLAELKLQLDTAMGDALRPRFDGRSRRANR